MNLLNTLGSESKEECEGKGTYICELTPAPQGPKTFLRHYLFMITLHITY